MTPDTMQTNPWTPTTCRDALLPRAVAVGICVVWLGLAGDRAVWAAKHADAPPSSGDLDAELFSDLDPLPISPPPQEEAPQSLPQRPEATTPQAAPSGRWETIAADMNQVRRRLSDRNAATATQQLPETQQLQEQIVNRLDRLIAELKRQQPSPDRNASSPAGSPPQSSSPQQAAGEEREAAPGATTPNPAGSQGPVAVAGSDVISSAERDRLLDRAWGNLPAAERRQLQSARPETFLPQYARQIEAYFQRLAEEVTP